MHPMLLLVFECGVIGLAAGVLGGLAGIGGSLVILPALHLFLREQSPNTHHLYMAAAMTVNIAVSLPAALRHHRMGAVRLDLMRTLLVSTLVFMVVGVLVGNMVSGDRLRLFLAGFLLLYCLFNLWRVISGTPETGREFERATRGRLLFSGGCTGFIGGLLGLGGGTMLVPMLQMLSKVELRQAIATSSAVICITSVVGAGLKLVTLGSLGESVRNALLLAGIMTPTAMVGGVIGASLTHALPVNAVRVIVTSLLLASAARLAGLV